MRLPRLPARRGRQVFVAMGLVISVACLAVLIRRVDGRALVAALRSAALPVLALTLVTKALSFLFLAARSRVLFGRFGRWPLGLFVRAHLLGFGGNAVLPLRLGELLRLEEMARRTTVSRSACLGVIAVERGLDSFWILLLALVLPSLGAFELSLPSTVGIAVAALALALAGAALLGEHPQALAGLARRIGMLFGRRGGSWLEMAAEGFAGGLAVVGSPARFVVSSLLTLGYWATGALGVALWIAAFHLDLPWYASAVVLVFLAVGAALPAAPGFVGTYDLFAASAFVLLGVGANLAAAVAVAGHFFAVVPAALVALGLFFDRIRSAAAHPADLERNREPSRPSVRGPEI